MNAKIRFERIALLACTAIVVLGTLGYFINEHLHFAGPPYFVVAFILSYFAFYWLTKKAAAGKIKWLVHD
jgi:hypothetical protein